MVKTSPANTLVFLDRDGVINRSKVINGKPFAPRSLNHFYIYKNAITGIRLLKSLGVTIVVVTNQPDVGNGLLSKQALDEMHNYMMQKVPLDVVLACLHSQKENCTCRKPNTAMFHKAVETLDRHFDNKYMVGDRVSDMDAGNAFGCKNIFIDRGYKETKGVPAEFVTKNLLSAALLIKYEICFGASLNQK